MKVVIVVVVVVVDSLNNTHILLLELPIAFNSLFMFVVVVVIAVFTFMESLQGTISSIFFCTKGLNPLSAHITHGLRI